MIVTPQCVHCGEHVSSDDGFFSGNVLTKDSDMIIAGWFYHVLVAGNGLHTVTGIVHLN